MAGGISSRQWIRQCEIDVAGQHIDLSDMQVQFTVRQMEQQHPNVAFIRITNLSDTTSTAIFQPNAKVKLQAGYRGRFGLIFEGEARQMRKGKEPNGTDKYFDIVATSMHEAYGFATVQKTLPAGATMSDVRDAALEPMKEAGVETGFMADLGSKTHPRAVTLYGMSRDILRYVADATNTAWGIQNGKFQMVKNDGYLAGGTLEINADTGMVGLPEQQLRGIVVKILLNPDAHFGQKVHIDEKSIQRYLADQGFPGSEEIILGPFANRGALIGGAGPGSSASGGQTAGISASGIYKIVRVDHDGVMEGNEWYTTLTCVAPDDTGAATGLAGNQGATSQGTMRGIPEDDGAGGGAGGGQ